MEERMDAIGEIIMEAGYPTVLCFQVTPKRSQSKLSTSMLFPRLTPSWDIDMLAARNPQSCIRCEWAPNTPQDASSEACLSEALCWRYLTP